MIFFWIFASSKMLLRSSSTPILSSLCRGALYQERGLLEDETPIRSRSLKVVTFSPSLAPSPGPRQFRDSDDTCSLDAGDWDFDAEIVPKPSFRRVRSDTDLHSLAPCLSTSSSLTSSPKADHAKSPGFYDGDQWLSNGSRMWSRRKSLMRQSSLSVISSNSDSGLESETFGSGAWAEESKSGRCEEMECESSGLADIGLLQIQMQDYTLSTMDKCYLSSPACTVTEVSTGDNCSHALRSSMTYIQDPPFSLGENGRSQPESVNAGTYTIEKPPAGNGTTMVARVEGCKIGTRPDHVDPMNFIYEAEGGGGAGGKPTLKTGTGGGGGDGSDSSGTETFYKRALESDPGNPLLLGNYARFLLEVKNDSLKAEQYYERAILASPGDGELLAQYAKLVWDVYKDEERAGNYFEQALEVAGDNCYVVAAYASFLWGSESNEEESVVESGRGNGEAPNFSPVFNSALAAPVASA